MSERVVDHLLTMLWRGAIDKLAAAVSTNFLLHSFLSPDLQQQTSLLSLVIFVISLVHPSCRARI